MATKVSYTLDEETNKSVSYSIAKNGQYTVSELGAVSITFYCMGVDQNSRLNVNYIKVTYKEASSQNVAIPQLSVTDGTRFYTSLTVTASCPTDGAKIYYTISDTGIPENPTELSDEFPIDGLTIEQTATIKAMAVLDGVCSKVVSVTYTKIDQSTADILRAIVFEKNGSYYAAVNSISTKSVLNVVEPVYINGKILNNQPEDGMGWYVDEAGMTIKNVDGEYVAFSKSGTTDLKFQTTKYTWKYSDDKECWYINDDDIQRTLLYSISANGIKAYAVGNVNNSNYSGMMQIMPFTDGYVRNVSGASAETPRFGTICLPNDVMAGDFSGAEFYSVLGKVLTNGEVTSVALSEPLKELKAGIPYIFCADSESVLAAYTGEAVTEPGSDNGLIGSLNDKIDVAEGKYLISNNKIQVCGTGCFINPNRAYVDFEQMKEYVPEAGVNARMLTFEDVTAVNEINANGEEKTDVYTVNGVCVRRRVNASRATCGLSKGIYIVDGKKMLVE